MKLPTLPKLHELSHHERLFAVGAAFALCLVLLDRVVLAPWSRHTQHLRQETRRLEESIRNDRQLLSRAPQILGELEAYREELGGTEDGPRDMAALIREIETLGKQSGVLLGQVKPLEGTSNDQYREYVIEVQYRGSLQEWVSFIYLLQTSSSLFQVERATIDRTPDNPGLLEGAMRLISRVAQTEPLTGTNGGPAPKT